VNKLTRSQHIYIAGTSEQRWVVQLRKFVWEDSMARFQQARGRQGERDALPCWCCALGVGRDILAVRSCWIPVHYDSHVHAR